MKQSYGYLLIVLTSAIWGTMGIFGKLAFEYGIDPVNLIALRVIISTITLFFFITVFRRQLFRVEKGDLLKLLILGLFGTALQRITYFYAIDLTTATILFYTYPIFVTIYAALFLKEKLSFFSTLAIILAFLGVALVVRAYESAWLSVNLFGAASGLACGVLFALYFLTTKGLRTRYTNWTLLFYGEGFAALALTPTFLWSIPKMASYPAQLWILVLIIAFFPSLTAYLIFSYALRHVESAKGSILSVVEPSTAAILSVMVLEERLELLQLFGLALALIGIILLFYQPKIKR